MSNDPTTQERIIDALQVIAPIAQQLRATARQQQRDAAALLVAVKRIVRLVVRERKAQR